MLQQTQTQTLQHWLKSVVGYYKHVFRCWGYEECKCGGAEDARIRRWRCRKLVWRRVVGSVAPDVGYLHIQGPAMRLFRLSHPRKPRQCDPPKRQEPLTHRHGVTRHRTWVLRSQVADLYVEGCRAGILTGTPTNSESHHGFREFLQVKERKKALH